MKIESPPGREIGTHSLVTIPETPDCEAAKVFVLKLFTRYVDDTLAGFASRTEAEEFLIFLNSLHGNIKFTMDTEDDFNKIAFLDLWIMKTPDGLDITVYRKPTHSGVYTHFSSFVPHRLKVQAISSLLERAYSICSDYQWLHREFDDLTSLFRRNGYTTDLIQSTIFRFLNRKRDPFPPKEGPEQFKVFLRLPYLGEASEKVEGVLNSSLAKLRCGKTRIILLNDYSRLGGSFPFKDRQPRELASGIVYKITCDTCNKFYLGETRRCAFTRFTEHCKKTGSGLTEVGKHLRENPDHTVSFDNFEILKYGLNCTKSRKVVEALLLMEHRSSPDLLNDMQQSIPLRLFNL